MADNIQPPLSNSRLFGRFFALRAGDIQFYRICDELSGALIFFMVLFGPWAFGTTQHWSIWIMNIGGGTLGVLLLAKLFIREAKGFRPPRWENFSKRSGWTSRNRDPLVRLLARILASLTIAILLFCLISALNAAATYNTDARQFAYHHYLRWLPRTLDSHRSWFYFWMYLGLAASFWAIRDWLAGMTAHEESTLRREGEDGRPPALPGRLRRLLWVLCINGALLGVESIVQRATGTGQLLFIQGTHINKEAVDQFGPYAYRSNAAQYFNLLWPLCLGFWWTLDRAGGSRSKARHVLLICAAIMAACPVISTSRGGALVSAGMLVLAGIYMAVMNLSGQAKHQADSRKGWGTTAVLGLFFVLAISLSWYFGWAALQPRMEQMPEGYDYREAMYEAAKPMAKDYPFFGTGPGTFATVFQLYRVSNETYWPEQLHNDWLETRITFGWFGLALALAALACVLLRWFAPGGIRGGRRFVAMAWLAVGGCLIHARFDFPLQVHSILLLFLLVCAMLFSMGRRSGVSQQ